MTITATAKTYRTVGYMYQIRGSSPASTGGVHHHQIARRQATAEQISAAKAASGR
jgi:hypothetical protein